jgi:hypothetical protein
MRLDQQLVLPRKINCALEREKFWLAISSAKSSPIPSPASQNAAALLFDLGTVDIR